MSEANSTARPERQIGRYWGWFAVSLLLLVPVDMLTTMWAAAVYGVRAEVNPWMRWLLRQGPVVLTVTHLVVVVLAVSAFAGVVRALRAAPSPYDRYLAYAVEVWLGLLVVAGLTALATNLSVIVRGSPLP